MNVTVDHLIDALNIATDKIQQRDDVIYTLSAQVEALTKERDDANERAFMSTESHVMTMGRAMKAEAERDALAAEVVRLDAGWHDANGDTLDKALELDNVKAAAKMALDAMDLVEYAVANDAITEDVDVFLQAKSALRQAGVQ